MASRRQRSRAPVRNTATTPGSQRERKSRRESKARAPSTSRREKSSAYTSIASALAAPPSSSRAGSLREKKSAREKKSDKFDTDVNRMEAKGQLPANVAAGLKQQHHIDAGRRADRVPVDNQRAAVMSNSTSLGGPPRLSALRAGDDYFPMQRRSQRAAGAKVALRVELQGGSGAQRGIVGVVPSKRAMKRKAIIKKKEAIMSSCPTSIFVTNANTASARESQTANARRITERRREYARKKRQIEQDKTMTAQQKRDHMRKADTENKKAEREEKRRAETMKKEEQLRNKLQAAKPTPTKDEDADGDGEEVEDEEEEAAEEDKMDEDMEEEPLCNEEELLKALKDTAAVAMFKEADRRWSSAANMTAIEARTDFFTEARMKLYTLLNWATMVPVKEFPTGGANPLDTTPDMPTIVTSSVVLAEANARLPPVDGVVVERARVLVFCASVDVSMYRPKEPKTPPWPLVEQLKDTKSA